jgi:hypothetical protein
MHSTSLLTLQARPHPFDTQQVEETNTTQQGQSSTQPIAATCTQQLIDTAHHQELSTYSTN